MYEGIKFHIHKHKKKKQTKISTSDSILWDVTLKRSGVAIVEYEHNRFTLS